jgi:hypothetical protein
MALSGKIAKRLSGFGAIVTVGLAAGQFAVSATQADRPKPLVPPPGGQAAFASSSATSSVTQKAAPKKSVSRHTPAQPKPEPKTKLRDVR